MKKASKILAISIALVVLLSACAPTTFSPPTEIHLNPGDQVKDAAIGVDDEGRSHIAGVANDRIVYYRTRFGEKLVAFEMTMGGSGANWKQYNPDIAVLDGGRAFVTWVEQRGGTDKFACYQNVPILVPIGGFEKNCIPLDGSQKTAGNVWVTARGTTAYAVYDRAAGNGRTTDLWYQQLAGGSATGRVDYFSVELKTAEIYSLDLGIDEGGFLHVGYHYNWTTGGPPPYSERMELRSNRATQPDGQMSQIWLLVGYFLIDYTPVSLSFYQSGASERVALAFGTYYQFFVESCTAAGCLSQAHDEVLGWPPGWWITSMVKEVKILGVGENLHIAIIGNLKDTPISTDQVYYTFDAFDWANPFKQISSEALTEKYDLEMTRVNGRENAGTHFAMTAWGETSPSVSEIFVYDGILHKTKVYETSCVSNPPSGEIGSSGIYFSGVWEACDNTLFTSWALTVQLPMIVK